MTRPTRLALALALALAGIVTATPATGPSADGESVGPSATPTTTTPTAPAALPAGQAGSIIDLVHPNPVAAGDRGEFVVVTLRGSGPWTLSDGEATVDLPDRAGRLVVTRDPSAVPGNVTGTRVEAPEGFQLANGGDRLALRRDGRDVDAVAYGPASEGEVLDASTGEWHPRGATSFPPVAAGPATVEAFVLPDAPAVPVDAISGADHRVLLAGYTLASWRVARALVAASERGATVRVLVDGAPVGGLTDRSAAVMDWLVARGVRVQVLAGPRARYDFHHPKYAVVDDRALVLTENFEPAGTGGHSSRGWGVVVRDRRVAAHLAAVFRADARWRDTRGWRPFRQGRAFEDAHPANGSYPGRLDPREVGVEHVRVLAAPDNAEAGIARVLRGAEKSVLVQQVSVGSRRQPFLRATVAAARRGVRVRVLLSSAWYVREENRALVEWLNGLAAREGLPVRARLAEPRSRYGKIHAKGVVVDGDTVVLGSVNWNNNSVRENREVALVLEGEAVGRYYARAFRADWRGGTKRVPASVVVAVMVATAGAASIGRRIEFERQ